VATILFLSWLRVAKPDTATGYQLDSITACVVSGVSLQGCRGSILGAAPDVCCSRPCGPRSP
jgi:ribose transport system permease protein